MYPVKDVYVTTPFGRPGSWWAAGKHTGTDFRADVGTPVRATTRGIVEHVGYGGYGSAYGNHVIIRSKTRIGNLRKHLYAHLSDTDVREGQQVEMGQQIGNSGNTGNTSGPHLHYEERVSPFGYYNYAAPVFLDYKSRRRVSVRLHNLNPGDRSVDVTKVRRRLRQKGIRVKRGYRMNKEFRDAYAKWQHRLGYTGKDANGIPGPISLKRLGFRVRA